MKTQILTLTLASSAVLAIAWGCSARSEDCQELRTCADDVMPGGASGATGKGGTSGKGGSGGNATGGEAGEGQGGGTSASAGTGGEAGGAAEGGAGGAVPCDGACGGDTAVCDPESNTCVQCLGPLDCDPSLICDTDTNVCVECLGNTDCIEAGASKCDGGVCVGCGVSEDCSHIDGKTVCDADASECVECTGTDYSACGEELGVPLVCDSVARTCTVNEEHAAGACQECVSDAHCLLGQMCVLQTYGEPEQDVGYFCFWKQGDPEGGAPEDCFTGAHPYAGVTLDAMSVDGQVADICSLRTSTCVARNQFSSKDCKSGGVGDDTLCGFDPPADAKCDQVGVSTNYRCTLRCLSNEDCPGVACNTGALQPYCEL